MSRFHIALFDHSVLQGRIYSLMPKEPLKLLNGHSFINGHCRQCPSELMRMYFLYIQPLTHFSKPMFDATDLYTFMEPLM